MPSGCLCGPESVDGSGQQQDRKGRYLVETDRGGIRHEAGCPDAVIRYCVHDFRDPALHYHRLNVSAFYQSASCFRDSRRRAHSRRRIGVHIGFAVDILPAVLTGPQAT